MPGAAVTAEAPLAPPGESTPGHFRDFSLQKPLPGFRGDRGWRVGSRGLWTSGLS